MKFAIIGAGSSYTPEILERICDLREELPVSEISLMDLNKQRLDTVSGFCERYAKHLGLEKIRFHKTTKLEEALPGADFVIVQIRVGGNAARINDEKIPLSYGLVGQETTGAGGFMNALRTIPAMLEIAHAVEKYCPDAWIVNYTNPTGIVAEAVNKYSHAKIAGLCAGGFNGRNWTSMALGVDMHSVRYDLIGLNHLSFAYNIMVGNKPLTEEQFRTVAEYRGKQDAQICMDIGALPSPYLQYYYHTSKRVGELKEKTLSRAEEVLQIEKEVYKDYADPACDTKPASIQKRGGGGYSEIALMLVSAIYNDRDTWITVNVPNRGTVDWLPDDAVIETGCIVNAAGVRPIAMGPAPKAIRGLISAVKNYEQLTVEAAVTGDMETAKMALLAHPLVGDWEIIEKMLPEMMEANKKYLKNFHLS